MIIDLINKYVFSKFTLYTKIISTCYYVLVVKNDSITCTLLDLNIIYVYCNLLKNCNFNYSY